MFKKLFKKKQLILTLVISFILIILIELVLGYYAWGGKNFAIVKLSEKTNYYIQSYLENYFKYKNDDLYFSEENKLFFIESLVPEKENFKEYLESEFEKYLRELINLVSNHNIEILFIYVPEYENLKYDYFETYYSSIIKKYNQNFINIKNLIEKHDKDEIFLLPYDHHYSRYTNLLIAKELTQVEKEINISKVKNTYCTGFSGPFKKKSEYDIFIKKRHPYTVSTNSIGFRDNYNQIGSESLYIQFILGDSFTHGPYLSNKDTFPYFYLNNLIKFNNYKKEEIEVINAGTSSFTIRDYYNILKNYLECKKLDFIIVQITDNDILDLSSLNYNRYNFLNEIIDIHQTEIDYYKYLKLNEKTK